MMPDSIYDPSSPPIQLVMFEEKFDELAIPILPMSQLTTDTMSKIEKARGPQTPPTSLVHSTLTRSKHSPWQGLRLPTQREYNLSMTLRVMRRWLQLHSTRIIMYVHVCMYTVHNYVCSNVL